MAMAPTPDLSPAGEIAAVMAAPAPFVLAVFAGGAVLWFVVWRIMDARYGGKISTLEERIRLRDEQYAALEKKVSEPLKLTVRATNKAIAEQDAAILRGGAQPVYAVDLLTGERSLAGTLTPRRGALEPPDD